MKGSMTRRWAASANGYRWLEAGLSQSPVATRASSPKLHPGLHKLDVEKSWLHVEDDCFARDMLLKELVFGDPGERDDVLVVGAEPEAEWEVWELVSAFLTRKFPETFTKVDGTAVRASRGDYDRVVDAAKTTPLEAASLLAQEDFFILNHDRLVSAACVFSFGAVRRRTRERQSLDELHAKVGGYRRDLATIVTKAITTVATKSPMWRSNWSFSLSDSTSAAVFFSEVEIREILCDSSEKKKKKTLRPCFSQLQFHSASPSVERRHAADARPGLFELGEANNGPRRDRRPDGFRRSQGRGPREAPSGRHRRKLVLQDRVPDPSPPPPVPARPVHRPHLRRALQPPHAESGDAPRH
mmetsp:Transcript_27162/g.87767  ORF Transcript_27162/g.87767 Transcript_27162/m.87767 type:complete len:356 (+) Transcript_27162:1045-2112(+)